MSMTNASTTFSAVRRPEVAHPRYEAARGRSPYQAIIVTRSYLSGWSSVPGRTRTPARPVGATQASPVVPCLPVAVWKPVSIYLGVDQQIAASIHNRQIHSGERLPT